MHRLCVHQSPDCETLYRVYWERVVRFCTTRLIACPDGMAEEVAQDVFLAAHCALTEGRYRGDGALSTWLFGIASNLCAKTYRDTSRKTILVALQHLERELALWQGMSRSAVQRRLARAKATLHAIYQSCLCEAVS